LIAATNRNLEEEVKNGHFREDLYYRLRVIPLTVPPLRERKEDLPLLIDRFIRRFSERENKQIEGIDHRALEWLSAYHWPGNVRQLENCIEGMIVMNTGLSTLTEDDVPEFVRHPTARRNAIHIPSGISYTKDTLAPELIRSLVMTVAEQRGEIISDITDEAVHHLSMVDWSRNGGALRRCIDMMVLLADHPVLEVQDIPSDYLPAIPPSETSTPNNQQEVGIQVGMSMEEAERRLIKTTLASCGHNKTHTARVLKIGLSTLFRKIKMYHLD
jgi:DNA-binding NtrC family response regulator